MSQNNSLVYQICAKLTKNDYDALLALTKNYSVNRSLIIREAVVKHIQNLTKAAS